MPLPFRRAAVVGLGVVGIPVAAKLAEAGIETTGVDLDEERVAALAGGRYPFGSDEPGIAELIARVHRDGKLQATVDTRAAVTGADIVIIVVQTPVGADGVPRYEALRAACAQVGAHLADGALVIVESTIAPGTMRGIVQPALEAASGRKAGNGFLLGHCPERVMPGRLLKNLETYQRVVGGFDAASTARMMQLYGLFVKGPLTPTDMTTAEVVKTTENAYRDVQIAFANEVARIAQGLGVDVWTVRELVNKVEDRNMHRPGVGVGGHCIPKDGLLLAYAARGLFEPEILTAARRVNEAMPQVTVGLVQEALAAAAPDASTGAVSKAASKTAPAAASKTASPAPAGSTPKASSKGPLAGVRVAVLGAAYLAGSDDTRHAPSLPLAEGLERAGAQVVVTDPYARRLGERDVSPDLTAALTGADVAVLATAHPAYLRPDWAGWKRLMRRPVVVDGRGTWDPTAVRDAGFTYRGVGR